MSSRAHTTALVQAAAEASGTAGHLEALVVAVHAVRARRAELAAQMGLPRMVRGSLAAKLSTLPARCAEESAKLEGVTARPA